MPANYVLLEKITVGATAVSTVTFSGIPQTGYTDLVVKMSTRRDSGANDGIGIRFNGSSAGNYSMRNVSGDGSSAASSNAAAVSAIYGYGTNNWATATASTFSNAEFYIPNYTSSNAKSVSLDGVIENNATGSYMALTAGLWSLTSAITSIDILPLSGGSFIQYSTFYLYGVAALGTTPAIVPYATGGDTIMTDGTYWYHAFLASGTFTPAKALSADVLVIAGGAGGAANQGGGGGAGGVCEHIGRSVSVTGYSIGVGAGGAATNMGSNSTFDTITALGGGNSTQSSAGVDGGSGGGGGNGANAGGSATQSNSGGATGYGNDGGSGVAATESQSGGGGGSGAVGQNGDGTSPDFKSGNGGAGKNTWSTWASATLTGVSGYYAGGGGGGSYAPQNRFKGLGGAGGGGNGNDALAGAGVAGTANTGSGGGGGGGGSGAGGAGGSGIVIIRYAV